MKKNLSRQKNSSLTFFQRLQFYFLCFLAFAFIGWLYETILDFYYGKGFIGRGMLFGPYLAIYGVGGLILLLFLHKYLDKKIYLGKLNFMPFIIFLAIIIITTLVELISTYFLELAHIDWRSFWDYSNYRLHFQGRVSPIPSFRFGIIGLAGLYLVYPWLRQKFHRAHPTTLHIICLILLLVILIDFLCTLKFTPS